MSQPPTAAPISGEPAPPQGAPPLPAADPARARDLIQSITSDYYNISDSSGRPVASLIVLVDRTRVPVRAELHLNGNPGEETSRQSVRQAQHILEERYSGPETLPMQVWQSIPRSDPLPVPLPPGDEKPRAAGASTRAAARATARSSGDAKTIPWQPFAIGVAALVLVALLWGMVSWLRPDEIPAEGPTSGGVTEAVDTVPEGDLAPVDQPIDGAAPVDAAAPAAAESADTASETTDLPTSINAHPELTRGMRVRIKDGLRLVLRSEPGADAGDAVGYMQNGDEAEIIGGPRQLQGISDTIVWWEVRLDDGNIAWAAANTSDVTLLEPAN